jgi:hypothetical protein
VLFLDELPLFPRLVLEYSFFNILITNHMQSDPFIFHPNNKNYTKNVLDIKCVPFSSQTFVLNIFQSKTSELHWRWRWQAPTKCWYIYSCTKLQCITLLKTNLHQNPKFHNGMKL